MVKGPSPNTSRKPERSTAQITEENIDGMERDTIQKVNKALGALETAIANWDASKEKPADLKPKFMKYRRFYDALVIWQKKMIKRPGKELDFYTRLERLREFANICYAYQ